VPLRNTVSTQGDIGPVPLVESREAGVLMVRWCRVALVGLLVAGGGLAGGVAPAQALTVEQVCAGTEVTTYDPPLTLVRRPTTITVNGLFPTCTDDQAVTGSYTANFTTPTSCLDLWNSGTGTETLVWGGSGVSPSTFSFNVTATEVAGQLLVTSTGLITDGMFAPAGAQKVVALVTPNLLTCLTTGIPSATGVTTLTIQSP
jgi:hypothetical protein